MNKTETTSGGIGFGCILFCMFLVPLKLCNVIDWSWVWVCAPLWIPVAIALAIVLVIDIFAIIGAAIDSHLNG